MLTAQAVTKYFPKSTETQKEHMQQQGQRVQSTQEKDNPPVTHIIHKPQQKSKEMSIIINNIKNKKYTDQTGKFPVVSSQGNRYFMVLYKKDGNLILVKPMKTRSSREMCWAHNKLMKYLHNRGIKVV